jgi:hypothetical protein
MIDLKKLRGFCNTAINHEDWYSVGDLPEFAYEADKHFVANASPNVVLALLDMLDAAQKDAARYQWLKSQKSLELCSASMEWTRKDGSKYISTHYIASGGRKHAELESLDATIDEAMNAASSTGE